MIKVNGKEIEYSLFPNNEIKIAPFKEAEDNDVVVEMNYEASIDIVNLIFVKKYLDDKTPCAKKILHMEYIPYERMDRETQNQMFTCKYFGQFINDLGFDKVVVLDPHSNVCMGILNRTEEISITEKIEEIVMHENVDAIFFPDLGANKKYTEILGENENLAKIPFYYGNKHRNINTGKITEYSVSEGTEVKGKTVLIVDDLCVKGYTTLFAAKKLKELGAAKVIFYCSHCEPAIFGGELLKSDVVDIIYTTSSIIKDDAEKIKII